MSLRVLALTIISFCKNVYKQGSSPTSQLAQCVYVTTHENHCSCPHDTMYKLVEFYRTHTLCALSTVSTDCTCSDIVGLHCTCMLVFCIQIALHSQLHCMQKGVAYCNTFYGNPSQLSQVMCYREVGVVSNTFLPFSSSANAQNLLTTTKTIAFQRFLQIASCTRNAISIPYIHSELKLALVLSFCVSFLNLCIAT